MTKSEIAKLISSQVGVSCVCVKEVVQGVLNGIIDTLVSEGRIELRNFGVFEVRRRKARTARNPHTGKTVRVPERARVVFRPGLELTRRLRQMNLSTED